MSDESESPLFLGKSADHEMAKAAQLAVRTFKYFWRELTWEYRRIVPALELAAIKAPFKGPNGGAEGVEHMWLSDVEFDGDILRATLLNSPHSITSVAEGDSIALRLDQLEDWMYALEGRIYGGYTVQVLRARMSQSERRDHDEAWGYEFGDPTRVDLVPQWPTGGAASLDAEHPMSENMAPRLAEAVAANPARFFEIGSAGLNTLHSLALGGSLAGVKVLLGLGADPHIKTTSGKTARQLAELMGWPEVARALRAAEEEHGRAP